MVSPFRIAVDSVLVVAIAVAFTPAFASAQELATAQGTITISEARPGLRAPSCSELVVEARDALDNHLIAETQPEVKNAGACRYALSVPSQTAVWIRVQPVLVAGTRAGGAIAKLSATEQARPSSGSIALRFTIIASTTYFFAPHEQKSIPLSY